MREESARLARDRARHFVRHERAFHLGFLPTEQSNPLTHGLAEVLQRDIGRGLRMLQAVDVQVARTCGPVFAGPGYRGLCEALRGALEADARICFSGCGATGRLSILLESAWREFWQTARRRPTGLPRDLPDREDNVVSLMTGGDYALVRSVEGFEDYPAVGRQQVRDLGLRAGDVMVAISEGGETSSVIGTLHEAADRGLEVFFLFNNPAALLCERIERSREAIERPGVTAMPLCSGPMAVAGSTRMQATTFEMLVAGAALEAALHAFLAARAGNTAAARALTAAGEPCDPVPAFAALAEAMRGERMLRALESLVELEEAIYRERGRVTYFADQFLLDVFTDSTERSPTFMLPPFRKCDDTVSPPPWAFARNPCCPTVEAWTRALRRAPRCLQWDARAAAELGLSARFAAAAPHLGAGELLKFRIGNEPDPSRVETVSHAAVLISAGGEAVACASAAPCLLREAFARAAEPFRARAALLLGCDGDASPAPGGAVFSAPLDLPASRLRLWERLAIKLALNSVSTATMGRLGRLIGNGMAHVDPTNKKLVDRSARLIAELAGLSYEDACLAFFESVGAIDRQVGPGEEKPSPVAYTLRRLAQARAATGEPGVAG